MQTKNGAKAQFNMLHIWFCSKSFFILFVYTKNFVFWYLKIKMVQGFK